MLVLCPVWSSRTPAMLSRIIRIAATNTMIFEAFIPCCSRYLASTIGDFRFFGDAIFGATFPIRALELTFLERSLEIG
jgi:hypothetical protein